MRACDRRSFRSVNFMYSSWLRVALILCSGQVVVRVANVLPSRKSHSPASSLNWMRNAAEQTRGIDHGDRVWMLTHFQHTPKLGGSNKHGDCLMPPIPPMVGMCWRHTKEQQCGNTTKIANEKGRRSTQSCATKAENSRAPRRVKEMPLRKQRPTRLQYCLLSTGMSATLYLGATVAT